VLKTTTAGGKRARTSADQPKTPPAIKVPNRTIKRLSDILKLMGDEQRLKILLALSERGEMNVGALKDLLGQSQPAVSHHLTLLRAHELVAFRRDGKHNYYYLNSDGIRDLFEYLCGANGGGQKRFRFDDLTITYGPTK
jgi:DNA-binding transcriptional ArsR family regulator